MDDALTLLKLDHEAVKALLSQFESLRDRPANEKRATAERIIRELMVHETIEEQVLYPALREAAKREHDNEAKDLVAESKEEHHVVDLLMEELQDVDLEDEEFDAKMKVLGENVKHHIREEEEEMFPDAKDLLGEEKLRELGQVMTELKSSLVRELKPKRQLEH